MKPLPDAPQQDSDLAAESLGGNPAAFEALVRRYQSLICALIYNRCGNIAQSEDLAQETFVAAWKALPSLNQLDHFKPWLCQIARNISANAARSDSRKALGGR
jgi:RNA polymerase sigma factor (sigma-70 family)